MQRKPLHTFVSQAIDTILPPRCVISGEIVESQGMLSPKAWGALDFISSPCCKVCGVPFDFDNTDLLGYDEQHCATCLQDKPEFTMARASLVYNDNSRGLILSFKHGDKTHLIKAFVPWLQKAGEEILAQTDILMPVPLHRWRMIGRRYNQSALISTLLAKETGIKHYVDGLVRIRSTPSQGHLKAKEREKNVRKAFIVNARYATDVRGRAITLIDDVMTTGSTVRECTRTLLKAGAAKVFVLTLSRTRPHYSA